MRIAECGLKRTTKSDAPEKKREMYAAETNEKEARNNK
jgi:hypothetical protein